MGAVVPTMGAVFVRQLQPSIADDPEVHKG
jgi:hypothetical protein